VIEIFPTIRITQPICATPGLWSSPPAHFFWARNFARPTPTGTGEIILRLLASFLGITWGTWAASANR
jgi:hypothetical protein